MSLNLYQRALKSSDLTLSPVGMNAESYRIYEAMSMGSVPVIEDVDPTNNCQSPVDKHFILSSQLGTAHEPTEFVSGPHRLLRSLDAPVIFIKNWNELPDILAKERKLSFKQLVERRKHLVQWYALFQKTLHQSFLESLDKMADGV